MFDSDVFPTDANSSQERAEFQPLHFFGNCSCNLLRCCNSLWSMGFQTYFIERDSWPPYSESTGRSVHRVLFLIFRWGNALPVNFAKSLVGL